ncbi:MAG: hypothetical protein ACLVK9_06580, partial [Bacteroides ovatus]
MELASKYNPADVEG